MDVGALPPGVKTAAVLVVVAAGLVSPRWEIEVFPVAVGLIGARARAADFFNEQTGHGEGVIADEFGFEAPFGLRREQAVVRVASAGVGGHFGTLFVGIAGDDEADH